ncbi:hypothetical protein BDZ89DRAFT_893624, partial [Hymenopellis radicata]
AKSDTRKRQDELALVEKWMLKAVEFYIEQPVQANGQKEKGYRTVCKEMESRCWQEDQKHIGLDFKTLSRRVKGGNSRAETNARRNELLDPDESQRLIDYAQRVSHRGFPLSLRRIEEIANQIIKARDGDDFTPVGQNW